MRRLAILILMLLPTAASACAVCFSGSDRTRAAFFGTTMLLSLVPLGLVAGGVLWLRRKSPGLFAQEFEDSDWVAPAPQAAPPAASRGAD